MPRSTESPHPGQRRRRHRRGRAPLAARACAAEPHQDRLRHVADRRARRRRQAVAARLRDLARRDQRQGRPARPARAARPLRRPEQPGERARPLRQADRRGQGRPCGVGLCDQPDHAGDAGRDAEEHGLHGPVRHRRERQVQLRPLFRDHPERPGRQARADARLPRGRGRA